jgi:hypothetical protein
LLADLKNLKHPALKDLIDVFHPTMDYKQ